MSCELRTESKESMCGKGCHVRGKMTAYRGISITYTYSFEIIENKITNKLTLH